MKIADVVKLRSTCLSRSVGCVLVKDNQILATGYNGSIRGHEHCNKLTCEIGCKATIHAEVNAVISCLLYTSPSPRD